MLLRCVFAGCLVLLACSSSPSPGTTDGGSTDSGFVQGPCDAMPDAGNSEPCCIKYGSGACQAGNFCGSNNGSQPVCLENCTQADMATCTGNGQCATGACNTSVGKCESAIGSACDPSIGCAPPEAAAAAGCGNAVPASYAYCDPTTKVCVNTRGQCHNSCLSSDNCAAPTTECTGGDGGTVGKCCDPNPSDPSYSLCACP